jgi:hypothetical protein
MKAWQRYLGLGILAYVIFLVVTFPAVRAYPLLKESLAPLALYDLEGSLWSGRAGTADIGPYRLGKLSWESRAWKLLLGRMEFAWASAQDAGQGRGVVTRGLSGKLHFSETKANLPMAEFGVFIPGLPVQPLGVLRIELSEMDISDNKVQAAEGTVMWENAGFLTPQPVTLGTLAMTVNTVDSGIKGTLLDKGGALQAQGVVMLKNDGSYQVTGTLGSRDSGQPQIQQALALLGAPDAAGKVAVNWSGLLPAVKPAD